MKNALLLAPNRFPYEKGVRVMPSLSELRNRYSIGGAVEGENDVDESLIVDTRSHLRPAQVIEIKLGKALERGPTISYETTPEFLTLRKSS
jgi:hypothetical protein